MVEGQVVGLDMGASEYLAANRSGALIWPRLADGATPAELAERLMIAYGIDRATAERDVEDFLAILAARGLLDAGNDAPA
jgi:hypothetical protein